MSSEARFLGAGVLALLVSLLLFLANPADVLACKCVEPGRPLEEMAKFHAVFAGKVVSIEHTFDPDGGAVSPWDHSTIGFEVSTVWKGDVARDMEVVTQPTGGACGYPFEVDVSYVVYASGSAAGDDLSASICSRTGPLAQAGEDLSALGRGYAPGEESNGASPGDAGAGAGLIAAVAVAALVVAASVAYARRRRG